MKRLIVIFSLVATLSSCNPDHENESIAAASSWTRDYAKQQLQGRAAGTDCKVLLIDSDPKLDDTTVESIHYGTGAHTSYEGGVQQFAEDRKFRAVVYRDRSGGLWTYGAITRDEAGSVRGCR